MYNCTFNIFNLFFLSFCLLNRRWKWRSGTWTTLLGTFKPQRRLGFGYVDTRIRFGIRVCWYPNQRDSGFGYVDTRIKEIRDSGMLIPESKRFGIRVCWYPNQRDSGFGYVDTRIKEIRDSGMLTPESKRFGIRVCWYPKQRDSGFGYVDTRIKEIRDSGMLIPESKRFGIRVCWYPKQRVPLDLPRYESCSSRKIERDSANRVVCNLPNVGEERLYDKPKECLRGRLGSMLKTAFFN